MKHCKAYGSQRDCFYKRSVNFTSSPFLQSSHLQMLKDLLQRPDINANDMNEDGDTPLHSIVRSSRSGPEKLELLVALLTQSNAYIDHVGANGLTALHIAVQVRNSEIVFTAHAVVFDTGVQVGDSLLQSHYWDSYEYREPTSRKGSLSCVFLPLLLYSQSFVLSFSSR